MVTAYGAFVRIVRIRDRASEQRERPRCDAAFRRALVGAGTYDRAPDGPWTIQQENRSSTVYRSRDSQVPCEKHLFEADGPDSRPGGLSGIGARAYLSFAKKLAHET